MQTVAHGSRISSANLKLALAAAGIAAVLLGTVAFVTFQGGEHTEPSSGRQTVTGQSPAVPNWRLLEMNQMPESGASFAIRQPAESFQQYRFLEMNQLPEARPAVPDYRFLEMNQLPGDEQPASEAPLGVGPLH